MHPRTLRFLHRWLGLLFSLTLLTSTSSGVLHIVMTYTQSPPPPTLPSAALDPGQWRVPPAEILRSLTGEEVRSIRLLTIEGKPCYQVHLGGKSEPRYFDANTGSVQPDWDARYAREIAIAYLGGQAVQPSDYLTAFNQEYLNIFRILPVYRFDADDGQNTRVYVSTQTGTVTRHTDQKKQWEASVFTNLHKFGFIPNRTVRDLLLGGVTLGAFLVSLAGIWLFFATRKPRRS